jgi:RNA polymerase sigma factor (sigma-70 family)
VGADVSKDPNQQNKFSSEGAEENADEESITADADLQQYVLRKARLYLARWRNAPSDAAYDLRQRAFLKYYKLTEAQRKGIIDRRAYLNKVVKNEAADYIRTQHPDSIIQLDADEGGGLERQTPDEHKNIESGILLHEIWAQLEGDERHLFELIIQGYNSMELAVRLGISPPTARQRVSRLRNVLKELLMESQARPQ